MTGFRVQSAVAAVFAATVLTGCLGPRRSEYASSIELDAAALAESDRLWQAVQDTLRRHRFALDRVDRSAGIVTTRYETSQSLFEFWRHDVDTREDLWESTLNPIRRRAEVELAIAGEDGSRTLSVRVFKQRLSSPDRQFNSSGAAYQYFGEVLPSTTGREQVTVEDDAWRDIGRDPAMEEYLLRAILNRASLAHTIVRLEPGCSGGRG